jgi:hypothetical protein
MIDKEKTCDNMQLGLLNKNQLARMLPPSAHLHGFLLLRSAASQKGLRISNGQ